MNEKTITDYYIGDTHQQLVKARNMLNRLVRSGNLFTYLDPELTAIGTIPATNNRLEGDTNAQIRHMLRNHRGMSQTHRVKAIFWYCYQHTENPLPPAQILKIMPTDAQIEQIYANTKPTQNPPTHLVPADLATRGELHHYTNK
ncbi:hypothetical protein [Arcanobacterium phocae]|uniref:hypothetical protein n=1 Tax=Arcanobacterium phocae TaxID=131112 RepID=UPI001C0EC00D|nr:hypothetical protein [Arcanobacterium phocae]